MEGVTDMKIGHLKQLNHFLAAVNQSQGVLWLESAEGDRYNLKSTFCQYLALGKLLEEHSDELELVCSCKEDEALFYPLLAREPSEGK